MHMNGNRLSLGSKDGPCPTVVLTGKLLGYYEKWIRQKIIVMIYVMTDYSYIIIISPHRLQITWPTIVHLNIFFLMDGIITVTHQ